MGCQEVGVSLMMGPSHSPSQLVYLCEAKFISTVHDNRIGTWHVDSSFDNRRAHKYICPFVIEIGHHLL